MENSEKKVFIITPIGGAKDDVRREAEGVIDAAIIPTLEQMGFLSENISVAHRISESGSINKQIITRILNDDLAIVNLSRLNPNVMYELAVRHAARKPVVQICLEGTNLPFDIIDERTIFYTNDMKGTLELQDGLIRYVEEALKDEAPDNPIYRASELDQVIKNSSNSNINVDEYILERLDKIERSVNLINKVDNNRINKNDVEQKESGVNIDIGIVAKVDIITSDIHKELKHIFRDNLNIMYGYSFSPHSQLIAAGLKRKVRFRFRTADISSLIVFKEALEVYESESFEIIEIGIKLVDR
ncbi:hypothetical protein [Niallia sp. FSL R7-0271]|uniref:hypothetical protein n=1 Tax=Niallia sp. FSL R7-0271 TaxID=2921678 RepID=UPI0030F91E50